MSTEGLHFPLLKNNQRSFVFGEWFIKFYLLKFANQKMISHWKFNHLIIRNWHGMISNSKSQCNTLSINLIRLFIHSVAFWQNPKQEKKQ